MLDITTIILTFNEEIHIRRCLENVSKFSKRVVVVDSPSTDRTVNICHEFQNVEVVVHKYPGNQAQQFNWALDNCKIDTEWVLRLDADEYCTPELVQEMKSKIPSLPKNVSAIVLPLGRAFMGKILKHGIVNGVEMIRLFRFGKARYEERMMDEHLKVLDGETVTFSNKFIDDNRCSLKQFVDKHNGYSSKEAFQLLDAEYHLIDADDIYDNSDYCAQVRKKRAEKEKYAKMPLFWRSFLYFCYRRYFKLGILDGKEGFCWDFFQGLWYRMLVDGKVFQAKKDLTIRGYCLDNICDEGKAYMIEYIEKNWNIKLNNYKLEDMKSMEGLSKNKYGGGKYLLINCLYRRISA